MLELLKRSSKSSLEKRLSIMKMEDIIIKEEMVATITIEVVSEVVVADEEAVEAEADSDLVQLLVEDPITKMMSIMMQDTTAVVMMRDSSTSRRHPVQATRWRT